MFRPHRSFPSIPTWKAWLLLWSQDTVHIFHRVCGHRTRARHGEMVFAKCRHVCFSPSVPYFSGLVLRTTLCRDIGMFSGSLNLQTCTLLGNLWCLKDILPEWQELGTAEGLGCQKVVICRAGIWLDTGGSIRRVYQCPSLSRHCSFCHSLSPKERVQTCVREQNCSCLQDRFGSSVCLILTFTSNF